MRANLIVGISATILTGCLGIVVVGAASARSADSRADDRVDGFQGDQSRVWIGLAYARDQNIPLTFQHRDRNEVGLGSYLVNAVGGCNDCHTQPPYSMDPYAALHAPKQVNVACYLAGGQVFGPFVSRDITPWENGKPAGLTWPQFRHVLRTGEDPDHPGQVLQVMPWPVYQTMTDTDLHAIYEYLSSIPPIPANSCGVPSEH